MTFARTSTGIANHHLFTGSTFTVYVEGDGNADPSRAVDNAFWREFFRHYYPHEVITFRNVGGKHHVLSMLDAIVSQSIANALCAVDADYRAVHAVPVDERLFVTFGYGVENDLLSPSVFEGLVRAILPGIADPKSEAATLWSYIETTIRLDWCLLLADQLASCRASSTLNRDHPQADLSLSGDDLPLRLRREAGQSARKAARQCPVVVKPNGPLKASPSTVPAHHYFYIVYHTFKRWYSRYSSVKYRIENFVAVLLGVIQNSLFAHAAGAMRIHYDTLGTRDISKYRS